MTVRRYLVTGGTGFIGAALVRRLVHEGNVVRVLDNQSRGARRRIADLADAIDLIDGDIRDGATVTRAVRGTDTVIHLAAVNGTEFFYNQPELVLDVALRGILAVIDACRANGVGDLVIASSSEVYQTPPSLPTPETVALSVPDVGNPRYSYGGGKIASELVGMNYGRTGFDRLTIFRPHNVYGPDMGWEHVLPQLILRATAAVAEHPHGRVPFRIQGSGRQTRAFIHIDDFVDGLMTVIRHGAHLNIYNIGTGEEQPIAAVAQAVLRCFDREAELLTGPEPPGATPRRCPDITKLRALGFSPRLTLADGLPETVAWYREHGHLRPAAAEGATQ
jgi:dTDP-glucose 4,6-dehydratase/UDP-glucose 4-epimerase